MDSEEHGKRLELLRQDLGDFVLKYSSPREYGGSELYPISEQELTVLKNKQTAHNVLKGGSIIAETVVPGGCGAVIGATLVGSIGGQEYIPIAAAFGGGTLVVIGAILGGPIGAVLASGVAIGAAAGLRNSKSYHASDYYGTSLYSEIDTDLLSNRYQSPISSQLSTYSNLGLDRYTQPYNFLDDYNPNQEIYRPLSYLDIVTRPTGITRPATINIPTPEQRTNRTFRFDKFTGDIDEVNDESDIWL